MKLWWYVVDLVVEHIDWTIAILFLIMFAIVAYVCATSNGGGSDDLLWMIPFVY